jgi:hypothetical protein
MRKQTRFHISAIVSTTLLVAAGIVGVVSDLKNLSEKVHLLPVFVSVTALLGIVAAVVMWRNYHGMLAEVEHASSQSQGQNLALGESRAESDWIEDFKDVLTRKGISEIDIGGLALRSSFFRKRGAFAEKLLAILRDNKQIRVRVWLLDPRAPAEAIRMREWAEREKTDGLLQVACRESLETLREIVLTIWQEQGRRRPEVVLVNKVAITHSIFRVDKDMMVCLYLQHGTGNQSPAIRLHEGDRWFDVYKQQFEVCFHMHSAEAYPPDADLAAAKSRPASAHDD